MKPFPRLFLLSLLLVLSLLPDAQAQAPAMRPPPVRPPPAHTPGYQPVTPADPVHTPAGAGASHGGLASPEKAVPRSPNKRLLPPTKEAGLWAADGAPVASAAPLLFDVEVPFPESATTPEARQWTLACVGSMTSAAQTAGQLPVVAALPDHVRRCFAARAMEVCASIIWLSMDTQRRAGKHVEPGMFEDVRTTKTHASAMVKANCSGPGWTMNLEDVFKSVGRQWADDLRKPSSWFKSKWRH